MAEESIVFYIMINICSKEFASHVVDTLIIVYAIMTVIGLAIYLWLGTKRGKNGFTVEAKAMEQFEFIMIVSCAISVSFLLWLYTKSGKKWLKNL